MVRVIKARSLDDAEEAAKRYGGVIVESHFKVRIISNPEHREKPKKKAAKA